MTSFLTKANSTFRSRWHYVAAVIDLYARCVVGWAFSPKPDSDLVIKSLDMAYEQRGRPQNVLFHSDQGSQYGSRAFRQRLGRYRFEQSMKLQSTPQACLQTSVTIETTFGSFFEARFDHQFMHRGVRRFFQSLLK